MREDENGERFRSISKQDFLYRVVHTRLSVETNTYVNYTL